MAGLATLAADMARLLDLVAGRLVAAGVDVPDRRVVAPGPVAAWDGEQLTVSLQGIQQGQPGQPGVPSPYPTARVFSATLAVELVRETPTLGVEAPIGQTLPDADSLTASGQQLVRDAVGLARAAADLHTAYAVTGPGVGFVVGPVLPLQPQGALAGNRLLVELGLSE